MPEVPALRGLLEGGFCAVEKSLCSDEMKDDLGNRSDFNQTGRLGSVLMNLGLDRPCVLFRELLLVSLFNRKASLSLCVPVSSARKCHHGPSRKKT